MACCGSHKDVKTQLDREADEWMFKRFHELVEEGTEEWSVVSKDETMTIEKKKGKDVPMLQTFRSQTYIRAPVAELQHYFTDITGLDHFDLVEFVDEHHSVFSWVQDYDAATIGLNGKSLPPVSSLGVDQTDMGIPDPKSPKRVQRMQSDLETTHEEDDIESHSTNATSTKQEKDKSEEREKDKDKVKDNGEDKGKAKGEEKEKREETNNSEGSGSGNGNGTHEVKIEINANGGDTPSASDLTEDEKAKAPDTESAQHGNGNGNDTGNATNNATISAFLDDNDSIRQSSTQNSATSKGIVKFQVDEGEGEASFAPPPPKRQSDSKKSFFTRPGSKAGRSRSKNGSGASTGYSTGPVPLVAKRQYIFERTIFPVVNDSERKSAIVLSSIERKMRLDPTRDDCVRGKIHLLGFLIEELDESSRKSLAGVDNAQSADERARARKEAKEPRCKVSMVSSIDPRFDTSEALNISEENLSMHLGMGLVKRFLRTAERFFDSEENRKLQQFRMIASAPIGTHGWQEQERSKNELQLGTNIQHTTLGHGIVRKFDMRGNVHVAYDDGTVVEHPMSEKDDLRVAVQIGTRVVHPKRGAGTVKQFDDSGRVHVKFDNNEYHRYKQEAWKKKMHKIKLKGIGGALETVELSSRQPEESREIQGRVKFAVGVTTREVLDYILEHEGDDEKSGNIISQAVVEEVDYFKRVRYEHRNMPSPLTSRDFVFEEIWREIGPETFVVYTKSVKHPSKSEVPGVVRGELYDSGWLIEPIYSESGDEHVAQVSRVLCIDPKGFVPPDSVAAVRMAQLLGALTDMRAFFWRRTQQKKDIKLNRSSKRISKRRPSALGGSLKAVKSVGSMMVSPKLL